MTKRRVAVEGMDGQKEFQQIEDVPRSSMLPSPAIPTGSPRHITAIREGKISGEIFCKDPTRRQELGYPIIYPEFDEIEVD